MNALPPDYVLDPFNNSLWMNDWMFYDMLAQKLYPLLGVKGISMKCMMKKKINYFLNIQKVMKWSVQSCAKENDHN